MYQRNWNEIIAEGDGQAFLEAMDTKEPVLEICGVDCHEQFFIERTAAKLDSNGIRSFRLTAPVELDTIVSIRPICDDLDNKASSALFQVSRVEKAGGGVWVQVRRFDPLPDWPLRKQAS